MPTPPDLYSALLRTAIEGLTDDLVVEILVRVRVPLESLCRFRCVSKQWRGLIDHPDHRKRFPQTLAGFLHIPTRTPELALGFVNVSGTRCPPVDVSFSFLPYNNHHVQFLDYCNGLLLCRWYHVPADDLQCRYVVCNPATPEWAALPDPSRASCMFGVARLGFDPAGPSNFYVFMLLPEIKDRYTNSMIMIAGVEVYSSETGRWVRKKTGWGENIRLCDGLASATVFLNGSLHFLAYGSRSFHCLATVDIKGETWTIFRHPGDLSDGFLQHSQGCLHYSDLLTGTLGDVVALVVYVLKDYDSKEWILKHKVENSYRSGGTHLTGYCWIVIHPQRDVMFLAERWGKFVRYNMDHREIKVISLIEHYDPPYLPYVPFYAKLQSLQK